MNLLFSWLVLPFIYLTNRKCRRWGGVTARRSVTGTLVRHTFGLVASTVWLVVTAGAVFGTFREHVPGLCVRNVPVTWQAQEGKG